VTRGAGRGSGGTAAGASAVPARLSKAKCAEFLACLAAANPAPRGELAYGSEFQLLVAVILSAQATDASVNKATSTLFAEAPDAAAMLALGEIGIKRHIRSIGLFNTKAANLVRTCRALLEQYDGRVPRTRAELERLPGVGRKTANVVLNVAFGEPTIAVDTHVFRVANRSRLAPGKTPLAVERTLLEIVPEQYRRHAHHWLILHGRYVCTARLPRCQDCVAYRACGWLGKRARRRARAVA
jgi:endonuclease III